MTVKKRNIAIVLLLALIVAALGGGVSAKELFFVAVNDTVPLTLSTSEKPYSATTGVYVPYTVFDAAPGGVVEVFSGKDMTLRLYTKDRQLLIDFENGKKTDENGTVSDILTTYKNGFLFVPLAVICEHFGLKYSILTGKSGCTVLRFTTGSEVYDDDTFLKKAENLLTYRMENYDAGDSAGSGKNDGAEKPEQKQPEEQTPVYLALTELSQAEGALGTLSSHSLQTTWFLTEAEITAHPETVRLIFAAGGSIGLTVAEDEADAQTALDAANEALCAVLHQKTLTALLTAEQRDAVVGYRVFTRPKTAYTAEQLVKLPENERLLVCTEQLPALLIALRGADAQVKGLRETSPIG